MGDQVIYSLTNLIHADTSLREKTVFDYCGVIDHLISFVAAKFYANKLISCW